MGDSDDPREVLRTGDVTARAKAARDLAQVGSFDDLEQLIAQARSDKSPSVRLYTAAAAADIAMRERAAGTLGKKRVDELVRHIGGADPGQNPSLLMVWAAIPEARVLTRLGRMLRDPRNGVRAGVTTAVRRMALSSTTMGDTAIADAVRGWLEDDRTPPDVVVELVNIVGEVGWTGLDAAVRSAAVAGRPQGEAVQQALERLAQRGSPEAWTGLWTSSGADVFEPEGDDPRWLVVADGRVWDADGAHDATSTDDDGLQVGGRTFRRIWAPRLAEDGRFSALQEAGRTWWRAEGKEAAKVAEKLADALAEVPEAAKQVADQLADVDGAVAPRVRATLLWKAGDLKAAEAIIDPMCGTKKPRADLFWIQANIKLGLGDLDTAREAVDRYLDRVGKKAPYRADAEALKASLGG